MTPALLPPEGLAAIEARWRVSHDAMDRFTAFLGEMKGERPSLSIELVWNDDECPPDVSLGSIRDVVVCANFIPALLSHITAQDRALSVALNLLYEARQYIDGEIDVVDGDYGEPAPNKAMQLASAIDEVLR